MGFEDSISDSWTPEIREEFIQDWMNYGFGKKRNRDEMHDDNDSGTDVDVDEMIFLILL